MLYYIVYYIVYYIYYPECLMLHMMCMTSFVHGQIICAICVITSYPLLLMLTVNLDIQTLHGCIHMDIT